MQSGLFGFFIKNEHFHNIAQYFPAQNLKYFEHLTGNYLIGANMLDRLSQDRFFENRNQITISLDGINLTDNIQTADDFFEKYRSEGIHFVKKLKGSFSGFILDEEKELLHIFNDHLATKSIYFYYDAEKGFAFSSSLQVLTKAFRKHNINYSIDNDAVYMMGLYGFILEDHTYINEIKKLQYSSILTYNYKTNRLQNEQYFTYSNQKQDISYNNAIDKIEELLPKSINKIWQKNKQYSDQYFTMLSGGMDARINALIAHKQGFKNITSLTFGQSGSKDIVYAKQMADAYKFKHNEGFLDGGDYLIDHIFDNYIKRTDGMIFYNGPAHFSSQVHRFDLSHFPMVHSGQIGDVLFGAFVKEQFDFHKNKDSIGYTGFVIHKHLLDKIKSLPSILDKYQARGFELYIYEQRQIQATIVGDKSISDISDTISPFYDRDLISFCMSMPDAYKKYQILYFDWLKKYHPDVVNYPWDKINMKPNKHWKIKYGKIVKKYVNGARKYFNWNYESMNPYGTWLKNNPKIIQELNQILETEISQSYVSDELAKDLKMIYKDDIFEFRNKFAVITVLLALKLHFSNDF